MLDALTQAMQANVIPIMQLHLGYIRTDECEEKITL